MKAPRVAPASVPTWEGGFRVEGLGTVPTPCSEGIEALNPKP